MKRIPFLHLLAVILCCMSGRVLAEAAAAGKPILDETCYWRSYIQFGLDRLDPAVLKAEGEKVLGATVYARLEKKVQKFFAPPFVEKGREPDFAKSDWRDNAPVWFSTTQWGTGEEASFFSYREPPPGNWMAADFDDGVWTRQRVPLMVGNFRRERAGWGQHEMQQMEVKGAFFRTTFDVPDPAASGDYVLKLVFRGGGRVFLNGKEIARSSLPQGELAPEIPGDPYPMEAYLRMEDEGPPGGHAGVVKSFGVDFCADLMGQFEDAFRDAKPGESREYWDASIGWGGCPINRKGWDRVTKIRNRVIGPLTLPRNLLKKGHNVLAVELRSSRLHPIVCGGAGSSWGVSYFLHATFSWSHCRLLNMELRAASADAPSGLQRSAGVKVWVEDMHRRCYSTEFATSAASVGTARIAGAANGTYSAQLAIGTDRVLTGLKVTPSDLVREGGGALAAAALTPGYCVAHPVSELVTLGLHMCMPGYLDNPLVPPAEMALLQHGSDPARAQKLSRDERLAEAQKLQFFDHISPSAPQSVPANTCQPLWLSLKIPADAAPGLYRGTVKIEAAGMEPVSVPVEAEVIGWRVPDPKDFQTIVALDHSPYGVAKQYGVKPWTGEHLKLLEASLKQLARVGNSWCFVPVINNSEFGNMTDSAIKWIRKKDGTLTFDYTALDRYLDLVCKHWGLPRVICFVIMHGAGREGGGPVSDVTVYNEATGQSEVLDVSTKAAGRRDNWKTFALALRAHMKARNLEQSMYWGFSWDIEGDPSMIPLMAEFTPQVPWAGSSHNGLNDKIYTAYSTVTRAVLTPWSNRGWKAAVISLLNPRSGNQVLSSNGNSPPFTYRLMADRALMAGMNGIGRVGADYWKDSYLQGHKGFFAGGFAGMPCVFVLWPGQEGAESSARFEAFREGLQEGEARIFLEQALERGTLPKELAERAAKVLFEHNRETLYISAGRVGAQIHEYCNGWQERSRRLYGVAAEAAGILGFELDRREITATVPVQGKKKVQLKLRNWGVKPREWKAAADQPWIVPAKTEGSAAGIETLEVTLDGARLKPDEAAKGTLTITDVQTGTAHAVAVSLKSSSKVFEFSLPVAYNFYYRPVNEYFQSIGKFAVLNVPVGGEEIREFSLFNFSGAELSWKIESPVPWLTAEPSSGKIDAGESLLVKIKVKPQDKEGATHETLLTVSVGDAAPPQQAKIVTHVILPYKAPAAPPQGEFVYLEDVPVKSHRGVFGDKGGPLYGLAKVESNAGSLPLPPHAMPARIEQETSYNLAGSGLTTFAAKVRYHPEHAKQDKSGLDKLVVQFEVHVDGKVRAQSGLMRATDEGRQLVVDITGAKEMRLLSRFDAPEGKNAPRSWIEFEPYGMWEEPRLFGPADAVAKFAALLPFPAEWNMVGPFAGQNTVNPPETEIKLDAKYPGVDQEIAWRVVKPKSAGVDIFGDAGVKRPNPKDMTVYGLLYAHCDEDMEALIEARYAPIMKIWLNGTAVLDDGKDGYNLVPVKLAKGANAFLVRTGSKHAWVWYYRLRLAVAKSKQSKIKLSATK